MRSRPSKPPTGPDFDAAPRLDFAEEPTARAAAGALGPRAALLPAALALGAAARRALRRAITSDRGPEMAGLDAARRHRSIPSDGEARGLNEPL